MEYYSAMRKKEILPFAKTWMDVEGIVLSEISQTEEAKYCIMSLIQRIWKSQTYRNSRMVVARCWGWREMGVMVKRYTFS